MKRIVIYVSIITVVLVAISLFIRSRLKGLPHGEKNFKLIFKYLLNKDMALTYFTYDEFDARATSEDKFMDTYMGVDGKRYVSDSGEKHINRSLVHLLDIARGQFGEPIDVHSGVRFPLYNSRLKGASPTSSHLPDDNDNANAADIGFNNMENRPNDRARLLAILKKLFIRIGHGKKLFHVDTDTNKNAAIWVY